MYTEKHKPCNIYGKNHEYFVIETQKQKWDI